MSLTRRPGMAGGRAFCRGSPPPGLPAGHRRLGDGLLERVSLAETHFRPTRGSPGAEQTMFFGINEQKLHHSIGYALRRYQRSVRSRRGHVQDDLRKFLLSLHGLPDSVDEFAPETHGTPKTAAAFDRRTRDLREAVVPPAAQDPRPALHLLPARPAGRDSERDVPDSEWIDVRGFHCELGSLSHSHCDTDIPDGTSLLLGSCDASAGAPTSRRTRRRPQRRQRARQRREEFDSAVLAEARARGWDTGSADASFASSVINTMLHCVESDDAVLQCPESVAGGADEHQQVDDDGAAEPMGYAELLHIQARLRGSWENSNGSFTLNTANAASLGLRYSENCEKSGKSSASDRVSHSIAISGHLEYKMDGWWLGELSSDGTVLGDLRIKLVTDGAAIHQTRSQKSIESIEA